MLPACFARTQYRYTSSSALLHNHHRRISTAICAAIHQTIDRSVTASVLAKCGEREQRIAIGELARMSDGSAVVEDGATAVLATVVSPGSRTETSTQPGGTAPSQFVPLTVDYRQRAASAGRIPTNYLRREMGPSTSEILTSRVIDRSLRPMFPPGFSCDTNVTCQVLSTDSEHLADVLAVNACSAALACSPVPWLGPVAAVRVGLIDGEPVMNPTRRQLKSSSLNLLLTTGSSRTVVMMEAAANNTFQRDFVSAFKAGVRQSQSIITAIKKLQAESGVTKQVYQEPQIPEEVTENVHALCSTRIRDILKCDTHDKQSRDGAVQTLRQSTIDVLRQSLAADQMPMVSEAFNRLFRRQVRDLVSEEHVRCDGRRLEQMRPLDCRVGLYQPLHGSALFQRGQTQVLATVAFDSPESALKSRDSIASMVYGGDSANNFMLHYDFPSFANGELSGRQRGGGSGGPGRREIGHGALAERALRAVVPRDHPLTIRLTTEVLESNGSSSMAAVCAGSMALLDAGVSLTEPVAGIAIGLVTSNYQSQCVCDEYGSPLNMTFVARAPPGSPERFCRYTLLTDLMGIEDYCGDMDFKLACTATGITALQADFKVAGVPSAVVVNAIYAGRTGIGHLLNRLNATINAPRAQSDAWPQIEQIAVAPHQRARFVGAGGANLRRITAETGVQVTAIDETTFSVFAPNSQAMDEARQLLQQVLFDADEQAAESRLEFGAVYRASVVEVRDTGVMVRLHASLAPALVRTAQLDQRLVRHPSALGIAVGDLITVKYFGRDPVNGEMRLSRKAATVNAGDIVKSLDGVRGGVCCSLPVAASSTSES